MLNLVLYGLKFVFIFFLYVFIIALIRSVLKDTKLALDVSVDEPKAARLVLNFGSSDSKSFALSDKVIIGRSEAADINLDDTFASFNHARLYKQGNTYVVQDLKSTNGTLLNGKRIKKETLNNGDVISIGKAKLKFIQ